jgi:excinuclease ABC subunit C
MSKDAPRIDNTDRVERLRRQVAHFPALPGVYLMRDDEQLVIYVGKAKDLKARVRTYFAGGDGRYQIEYLLQRVALVEMIVTQTEEQAFLLERDLITKYKPRYNIRLKDDRAYLSIRIDENAEWPRVELVRKVAQDGAKYFGPYAFSSELRNLLEVVKKVLPLRSCSDAVLYNRTRPCLEYQIKRCCAPCCIPVGRAEYLQLVKQAISILEGRSAATVKQLEERMEVAANELRFEEAASWRDRLELLRSFQAGHSLVSFRGENRDVFAIFREGTQAALCVLLVRGGRISDTKSFSLFDIRIEDDALLEASLQQFYEGGRDLPDEILVPNEFDNLSLMQAGFSAKKGRGVSIVAPQRGSKARLLATAELNAKQAFLSSLTTESEWSHVSTRIAILIGLKQIPRRVECVDISNFQGTDIVGAAVVFFDGVADKSSYRKYIISQQGKPDDFAAIHEVVSRKLKRGLEEGNLPDLLVIDGGPGQLSMALQARDDLRLSLDIVGLAKMRIASEFDATTIDRKPERLYLEGNEEPILLDEGDLVTRFLARMRDEVHRFVITFHRQKRAKRVFASVLDSISGLGPERRGRLLKHFGSVKAIGSAPVEEVAKVGRMPLPLAEKVVGKIKG